MKLKQLFDMGFDQSFQRPGKSQLRVACSQCAALVINGTPCHESGCSNEVRECNGCNALVARGVRYCNECR